MDLLIFVWLFIFIVGRIMTSVARSKERQRYDRPSPVDRHQVELGQMQPTQSLDESFIDKSKRESEARTKIRTAETLQSRSKKHRNEGAGSQRNQSARLQQEQFRKLKAQSKRGKLAGSIKDYIESMSGSTVEETYQSADVELKRRAQSTRQANAYGMSMGSTEEIDWDNYEADFLANSEWADEDDDEGMAGVNQGLLDRPSAIKAEEPPLKTNHRLDSGSWKQAVVMSEILAKPKATRRR